VERSDEVRDVLSSLVATFGTPEMESAFANAMSQEAGTLMVGTDPAEWWDNQEDLMRVLKGQSEEIRGAVATREPRGRMG